MTQAVAHAFKCALVVAHVTLVLTHIGVEGLELGVKFLYTLEHNTAHLGVSTFLGSQFLVVLTGLYQLGIESRVRSGQSVYAFLRKGVYLVEPLLILTQELKTLVVVLAGLVDVQKGVFKV